MLDNQSQTSSAAAVASSDLLAAVERAYREGYQDGYKQGCADMSCYERGNGLVYPSTRQRRTDEAWESSETKAANAPDQRPGADNQKTL